MDCSLASILSAEEQVMVIEKLPGIQSFVWIGGKYIGTGGPEGVTGSANWAWEDGSAFAYENWNKVTGPTDSLGECMKLQPLASGPLRNWDNELCSKPRPAVYKCCGRRR